MRAKRGRRGRGGNNKLSRQAQAAVAQARAVVDQAIRQQRAEVEREKREAMERCAQGLPLDSKISDEQHHEEPNDGRR